MDWIVTVLEYWDWWGAGWLKLGGEYRNGDDDRMGGKIVYEVRIAISNSVGRTGRWRLESKMDMWWGTRG